MKDFRQVLCIGSQNRIGSYWSLMYVQAFGAKYVNVFFEILTYQNIGELIDFDSTGSRLTRGCDFIFIQLHASPEITLISFKKAR